MTSCYVYKVIRDLELIDHLFINLSTGAIKVEGIMRKISVNNFEFWSVIQEMSFNDFSISSSGGLFV